MKKNIIFCGTPKFAVASLKKLYESQKKLNFNLNGVITIPDKKVGRGKKMTESEIKKVAKSYNLPILEPYDLTNNHFINTVKSLKPDLIIVIAFKKLPKVLFEIPKIGTINLHASILPKYRGAAPINWAIINGENQTGLTTFFINEKIDTGDIILQTKNDIPIDYHAGELHDSLMIESSELIIKTINKLFKKNYKVKKQDVNPKKNIYPLAPKINKNDRLFKLNIFQGKLGLEKSYNFIRGMSPPGVKMKLKIQNNQMEKKLIITVVKVSNYIKNNIIIEKEKNNHLMLSKKDNNLIIHNHNGSFQIKRLKPENGKEMSDIEFINGFLNKNDNKMRIIDLD
ncbi:MAG: methionyl-tRNA formyltransferase [Flavobacteriales bacterium]|nr:methionyl-tRNA formyltransferase [Flavobacteriales bacterium]|tara:strand:- start:2003 stop:3025 length:1023 start_codon:yes stop_codon:yes gene_type:complete